MNMALIPGMAGPAEILLILVVILLLFGAKRLPELARSLGKSLSEFKKGKEEGAHESSLLAGAEDDEEKKDDQGGAGEKKSG